MIYARLCKDLDNELPQKVDFNENEKNSSKNTKPNTIFRSKLIEKCRKIFKDEMPILECKFSDNAEKELLEKDFILGSKTYVKNKM